MFKTYIYGGFFFFTIRPTDMSFTSSKIMCYSNCKKTTERLQELSGNLFFPSFTFPLLGPDGAAVATSELDPLPPSDLSTAIALLPLSPSVHHPLISVCRSVYPWTGCDSGGRGTATQRVKTK